MTEHTSPAWNEHNKEASTRSLFSLGCISFFLVSYMHVLELVFIITFSDFPFCRMSMKELLESKHPTAWSEFEKGLIDKYLRDCVLLSFFLEIIAYPVFCLEMSTCAFLAELMLRKGHS